MPEPARADVAPHLAAEHERPGRIRFHGFEEVIGHEHGQVEVSEPLRIGLCLDEGFNIGVVAAQGSHHRAPAGARGHDRLAHRVPDIHEAHGAGSVGANAAHGRALGPERREVVPDASPLLQRQRRLAHIGKDRAHIVADLAHDKAIEKSYVAPGPGACQHAAGGDEGEAGHGAQKALLPSLAAAARLGGCGGGRNPGPCFFDRMLGEPPGWLKAVLRFPDLPRNLN